jgi:hypothetical protein
MAAAAGSQSQQSSPGLVTPVPMVKQALQDHHFNNQNYLSPLKQLVLDCEQLRQQEREEEEVGGGGRGSADESGCFFGMLLFD